MRIIPPENITRTLNLPSATLSQAHGALDSATLSQARGALWCKSHREENFLTVANLADGRPWASNPPSAASAAPLLRGGHFATPRNPRVLIPCSGPRLRMSSCKWPARGIRGAAARIGRLLRETHSKLRKVAVSRWSKKITQQPGGFVKFCLARFFYT